MQKKDRQNLYFMLINKNGGLQFFTQFKEVYREGVDEKGNDLTKLSSNQALSASSIFYAIDNLTKTIIPKQVIKIEGEKEDDFWRNNSIDMLITDQYMVSCLLTMTELRLIVLSGKGYSLIYQYKQLSNLLRNQEIQQINNFSYNNRVTSLIYRNNTKIIFIE